MSSAIGCGEMCIQCEISPEPGADVQLSEIFQPAEVGDKSCCYFLCFYHRQKYRRRGYRVSLVLDPVPPAA